MMWLAPQKVTGSSSHKRPAGVETLVLYHLIPGHPGITDEAWTAKVEAHFAGQIIVAAGG
jgi:ribonuclease BN (tRNA processing enzyme)